MQAPPNPNLRRCPDCGRPVSPSALLCPGCGAGGKRLLGFDNIFKVALIAVLSLILIGTVLAIPYFLYFGLAHR